MLSDLAASWRQPEAGCITSDVVHPSAMAQPKQPPLSIRLKPELEAEVRAYAATNKLTMHGACVALIGLGLAPPLPIKRLPSSPKAWPSGAVIEPHHTEDPAPKLTLGSSVTMRVPTLERKAFNPQPKIGKK